MTPEKVALGKLPTDVWWHTIVSPTGREKTGYPTQKPEGILRRIVQASTREGDWVLDFFAGSGTTGAVAATLGRRFVLVDENPEAIAIMRARFSGIAGVEFQDGVSRRRLSGCRGARRACVHRGGGARGRAPTPTRAARGASA